MLPVPLVGGLTTASAEDFAPVVSGLVRSDASVRFVLGLAVAHKAEELKGFVRDEFVAGKHSRGVSHNKAGASLTTLKVRTAGLDSGVTMSGSMYYVDEGAKPHPIDHVNAPELSVALALQSADDSWFRGPHVDHPGFAADPFTDRALERLDLTSIVDHIAEVLAGDMAGRTP